MEFLEKVGGLVERVGEAHRQLLERWDRFGKKVDEEFFRGYLYSQLELAGGSQNAREYLGLERPENLLDRICYNIGYLAALSRD